MWVPGGTVTGWSRVTQTIMSRRARHVWLMVAFSMLLVWLYSYSTVHPTEPYLKRSHSSTTGDESVAVIFTNKNDNNPHTIVNDTNRNPAKLADRNSTSATSAREEVRDSLPVNSVPFAVEREFEIKGHVLKQLDSPLPLPSEEGEIPEGILQMFGKDEETNVKNPPGQRRSGVPGQKNPARVSSAKVNSSKTEVHEEPQPLKAQSRPEWRPQLAGKASNGKHMPDWAVSLFFSGKGYGSPGDPSATKSDTGTADKMDVAFSDLFNLDEQRWAMVSEEDDEAELKAVAEPQQPGRPDLKSSKWEGGLVPGRLHPEEKMKPALSSNSTKRSARHDRKVAKVQTGAQDTAENPDDETGGENSLVPPDAVNQDVMKKTRNSLSSVGEDRAKDKQEHFLAFEQPPELLDPDEQYADWEAPPDPQSPRSSKKVKDPSPHSPALSVRDTAAGVETSKRPDQTETGADNLSPESFRASKHKHRGSPVQLLLSEMQTAEEGVRAPAVDRPSFSAAQDKKLRKQLHISLDDLPEHLADHHQTVSMADDQQQDPADAADNDDDNFSDSLNSHKKTVDKSKITLSALNDTKTGKKHTNIKTHYNESELDLTVWKNVLKERKRLLRAKCQDTVIPKQNVQDTKAIVDRKRNVLYCPVAKSASGFFHRLMLAMKHNNRTVKELPSPFNISLQSALAEDFDMISKFHRKGLEEFMDNSLRFVVVREPFSRLFAAYVDRLLVPDTVYWKQWGVPATSQHRKYPSPKSLDCGHDVTFAEFVKYVIDTLHDSDDTVKPVSNLCAPCELRFSVIGHVETLVSDIEYLLSLLKLSIPNFSSDSFMIDVNNDIIFDSTFRAFQFHEQLKSCLSKYEMGKRLWRNLQIHGIISEELTFSFAPKKVQKMTPSDFIRAVQDARKILPDSEKVRQQKLKALKAAFEKVPAEDIMQLVKIYALDFEFFGYDRHPSFLS